jgi:uncharacterized protein YrrD
MKFKFGTDIVNHEGEKVAELYQVVIDPSEDEITHLVAKKGFLFPSDKVIPISLVMSSSEDQIKLYDFEGEFKDLDDFVEVEYVKAESERKISMLDARGINVPPLLAYPPAGHGGFGYVPVINYPEQPETEMAKNIPDKTVDIPENARVIGLNGEHVGNVEEVVIDPASDQVTHFVISKGLFFSEDKLIPVSWVKGYDSDKLKLVVNEEIVDNLPEYDR